VANQLPTKSAKVRQRIEKLEEELQKIKWEISFSKVLKENIVDLTKEFWEVDLVRKSDSHLKRRNFKRR
jgi:hypothetical protein